MTVLGIAKEHNTASFTRAQTWNTIMSDSSVLTVSKAVMPTTTITATIQCNYVNLHSDRSKFLSHIFNLELILNRPFAINNHMVQNLPCWRASSLLLFPHWDIKTKRPQSVKPDWPLF